MLLDPCTAAGPLKCFALRSLGQHKMFDSPSFQRAFIQGCIYKYLLDPDSHEEPFMLYSNLTSDFFKLCLSGLLHLAIRILAAVSVPQGIFAPCVSSWSFENTDPLSLDTNTTSFMTSKPTPNLLERL